MKSPHEIISAKITVSKMVISITMASSLIYLSWWFNFNNAGNLVLYTLLLIGEIYHVWQAIGYGITVWNQTSLRRKKIKKFYPVDIFITVCGEPVEIVEQTIKAAVSMKYPSYKVYVLNDGYVAKKENWKEINELALRYNVTPITRQKPGGAKAGNINNALKQTTSPLFAVFDADHIPSPNFLKKTVGYFEDKRIALVQTPQYYGNRKDNFLTEGAWEQQELFFGPICRGKNGMNATFWCGTNAVLRKKALESVGGIPENNIAEDFLVSLMMHKKGWKSLYIPEILAVGLAPYTLENYVKQQYRWARGSLEITFKHNPLFSKGLTWFQKVQYLYSSTYYLNGVIVLVNALIPLLVLVTGITAVKSGTGLFLIFFLPFIFLTIHLLMLSTDHMITFRAVQLSMSSFYVFLIATIATLLNRESKFEVTSKAKESGNYLKFVIPHISYIVITLIAIYFSVKKYGVNTSTLNNTAWAIFNITLFSGFIRAAYPWKTAYEKFISLLNYDIAQLFSWHLVSGREAVITVVEETDINKPNT